MLVTLGHTPFLLQSLATGATVFGLASQQKASTLTFNTNGNRQVGSWQNTCAFFRPLHETETVSGKIIAHTQKLELLRIGKTIKIKVVDRGAS